MSGKSGSLILRASRSAYPGKTGKPRAFPDRGRKLRSIVREILLDDFKVALPIRHPLTLVIFALGADGGENSRDLDNILKGVMSYLDDTASNAYRGQNGYLFADDSIVVCAVIKAC